MPRIIHEKNTYFLSPFFFRVSFFFPASQFNVFSKYYCAFLRYSISTHASSPVASIAAHNRKLHTISAFPQIPPNSLPPAIHKFDRVLLLNKLTRFEVELKAGKTLEEIREQYPGAYKSHQIHVTSVLWLEYLLRNVYLIHTTVVKAQSFKSKAIQREGSAFPPDAIISAGGDGTYLEAASLIPPYRWSDGQNALEKAEGRGHIWLFGVNTDPESSEGNLCLRAVDNLDRSDNSLEKCLGEATAESTNHLDISVRAEFQSKASDKSVHNHCEGEDRRSRLASSALLTKAPSLTNVDLTDAEKTKIKIYISNTLSHLLMKKTRIPVLRHRIRIRVRDNQGNEYTCLHRAVNDVLIAERYCSHTLYANVQADNGAMQRLKSSGVIVCTGTGSTAWAYNASKIQKQEMNRILNCFIETLPKDIQNVLPNPNFEELLNKVNSLLVFPPDLPMMRYIFRDPIENRIFTLEKSSDLCYSLSVCPLSLGACIYIDGQLETTLPFLHTAFLEMHSDDALFTAI